MEANEDPGLRTSQTGMRRVLAAGKDLTGATGRFIPKQHNLNICTCLIFKYVLEFPGCPGECSPEQCWSRTTQDKKQVDCRFKAAGSSPAAFIMTLEEGKGYNAQKSYHRL